MTPRRLLSFLSALLTLSLSSAFSNVTSKSQCGIYFAPSTIPGAGFGMFTGRAHKKDEYITEGDLVIPLVDWAAQNHHIDTEIIVMQAYYWLTYAFTGMPELSEDNLAFSPGIGAAINCFFPLINTQGHDEGVRMSTAGISRQDPGAGAFTPFFDRSAYATRDMVAGEELFTDYGEAYFVNDFETYGNIPLDDSYDEADSLLRRYVTTRDQLCSETGQCSPKSVSPLHNDWYSIITQLSSIWPSRTLNALPTNSSSVDVIAEIGTRYVHYNRSIRSIEWLEENGMCMDNIVIRDSTIPYAGRGAFASRFLPKGSVIAPSPLVHVDRAITKMYPGVYDEEGEYWGDREKEAIHQQLLLNYCFGHVQSSLLLCGYGMSVAAINHSPRPNAKIEWAPEISNHPDWLDKPHRDWIDEYHVGLAVKYVAVRDIADGEEVTIDYGSDWAKAWQSHVKRWKPPLNAESYHPAYELNEDNDLVIPTLNEAGKPKPGNVETLCHNIYRVFQGLPDDTDDHTQYCRAVWRKGRDGDAVYVAEVYHRYNSFGRCFQRTEEVLFDLPRSAFQYEDLPYTRDMVQPWSFRHHMSIPDDMMPHIWRDLR